MDHKKYIKSVHSTCSFLDGRVVISNANNLAAGFFFSVFRTRCSFIIKPRIDRFVLKLEHEFVKFSDVNILPHFTVVQKRFYLDIMFNFAYFEIKL